MCTLHSYGTFAGDETGVYLIKQRKEIAPKVNARLKALRHGKHIGVREVSAEIGEAVDRYRWRELTLGVSCVEFLVETGIVMPRQRKVFVRRRLCVLDGQQNFGLPPLKFCIIIVEGEEILDIIV